MEEGVIAVGAPNDGMCELIIVLRVPVSMMVDTGRERPPPPIPVVVDFLFNVPPVPPEPDNRFVFVLEVTADAGVAMPDKRDLVACCVDGSVVFVSEVVPEVGERF